MAQVNPVITSAVTVTVTAPAQLSDVMIAATFAAGTALAQETVTSSRQVIVGGVLSITVIVCAQVAVLPQTSVAIYVRTMINSFAQAKLVVTSAATVIATAPAQLSVATMAAIFAAGIAAAHVTVTSATQLVITGAELSSTVIVWLQVATLPQTSTAV